MVRKLIIALFLFSVALLSYDSLPYFHFSVYRPLSMFSMFAASFLLLFTDYRFKTGDYFLLAFAMYSAGHSLAVSIGYEDVGSSFKHVITLVFGLSMYRTSVYIAQQTKEDPALIGWIAKSVLVAFVPPIAAGFLQLLDALVVHSGFSGAFTGLFSEKVYKGRIQMLSGEPSWAAIHMLSGGLLMLFLFKQGYRRQLPLLIGTAVLVVLSFSAYAYSVMLTALLIYVLITSKNRGKMLLVLGVCVLIVAVGVPFLLEALHVSGYFTDRFQFNFSHMVKADNSFFIRVFFPAIGFIEFAHHPIFGVGGGFYYKEFASLLLKHFSDGLAFKEVSDLVFNRPEMATSRNLLAKVFAEEGLIGAMLLIGFMGSVLRSAGANPYAKFAFALCVSLVMNFDSYSFVNYWLLIGFIRGGFFDGLPAVREVGMDTQRMKGMKRIA
ncbi:O-antigen ligase family protein [Paenibacillus sacheonensis]|uniref:O-antigen ligase domain-containing protein n=1 Tax=Paenibacillus sacheonensis TaxID=742054 RepID=A0A7X4YT79_9BACL|nr:O-antigen ligase family protein [Paenibacillus sacheonensis]MBM7563610.1 hypothetical protein [Paenibacillus sacheonensis]NBC71094.1 O-antigen ligase domain-containing protein [Paenibacillus sacheonensis]